MASYEMKKQMISLLITEGIGVETIHVAAYIHQHASDSVEHRLLTAYALDSMREYATGKAMQAVLLSTDLSETEIVDSLIRAEGGM